jgi:hypothetical protein
VSIASKWWPISNPQSAIPITVVRAEPTIIGGHAFRDRDTLGKSKDVARFLWVIERHAAAEDDGRGDEKDGDVARNEFFEHDDVPSFFVSRGWTRGSREERLEILLKVGIIVSYSILLCFVNANIS